MAGEIERKGNKVDCGPEMRTRLEDDRLSSLPDGIIHHILFFIDTKGAVQTCVLSSRWKLIWTSLPHLNLDTSRFRILPKFSKFVNRILSRRNNYTEVSMVDIYFRGPIRQKILEKILSYATSHNVQELKIRFEIHMVANQLPSCLFKSESLKHLSLSTQLSHLNVFPCPQSPWNVPALTTLVLKYIWLCFEASSLDLFSKCVNLKSLTLDNCRARRLGVMQIFCPKLVNLILIYGCTSKYALLTPSLSYFYYVGDSEVYFSTNGLHCLDTVNLEMRMSDPIYDDVRQRDALRLLTMLQELRNAKNLIVHSDFIEFFSTVPDVLEHQPSPFSDLKCLKIIFYPIHKSTNSSMIDQVIKYLFNSSSSFNVIMEPSEYLSDYLYPPARSNGFHAIRIIGAQKRNVQTLYKMAEMMSSQEMTDPHTRQALEDVKDKLAARFQEFGLPLPQQ